MIVIELDQGGYLHKDYPSKVYALKLSDAMVFSNPDRASESLWNLNRQGSLFNSEPSKNCTANILDVQILKDFKP